MDDQRLLTNEVDSFEDLRPTRLGPPVGDLVAFVYSVVDDAARLWKDLDEAMARAIRTHDALLRKLIARHGGHEVRTEGDAFLIAFRSADHALGFAADAQLGLLDCHWDRGLLAHPLARPEANLYRGLRLRMGIHIGRPLVWRTNTHMEYRGPVVNLVRRVGSIAHPGQILLTAEAVESLSALPRDVTLRELPAGLTQALPRALAGRRFGPVQAQEATPETQVFATLEIRHDDVSYQVPITRRRTRIGRGRDCDLRITDQANTVSQLHCTLHVDSAGLLFVVDEGSTNGTWVAGCPVEPRAALGAGAELRLGRVRVRVDPPPQTRAEEWSEPSPSTRFAIGTPSVVTHQLPEPPGSSRERAVLVGALIASIVGLGSLCVGVAMFASLASHLVRPTPTPLAPPARSHLEVVVDPPAHIKLDGAYLGHLSRWSGLVDEGPHQLVMWADGHLRLEEELVMLPDAWSSFERRLSPKSELQVEPSPVREPPPAPLPPPRVSIETDHDDATVLVDSTLCSAPCVVEPPAGEPFRIEVTAPGHRPWMHTHSPLARGDEHTVQVHLEPLRQGFRVGVVRGWARIWVDDEPAGHAPLPRLELEPGEHELQFEYPDGTRTPAEQVDLPAGTFLHRRVPLLGGPDAGH